MFTFEDFTKSAKKILRLSINNDVKNFCEVAFKNTGINYFDYARFYRDNTSIFLTSDASYVDFFLGYNQYHASQLYVPPTFFLPAGKHLWNSYLDSTFLKQADTEHKHAMGVTIIRSHLQYDELVNFSGPINDSEILNIFINHAALLEAFIAIFVEKFSKFFKAASHKVFLSKNLYDQNKLLSSNNAAFNLRANLAQLKKSKHNARQVLIGGKLVLLTNREAQCLYLSSQGLSAKQIAKELKISFRTVEVHSARLLSKTNFNNKLELINNTVLLDSISLA